METESEKWTPKPQCQTIITETEAIWTRALCFVQTAAAIGSDDNIFTLKEVLDGVLIKT